MTQSELTPEEMQAEALTGFFDAELKKKLKGRKVCVLACSDKCEKMSDALRKKFVALKMIDLEANLTGQVSDKLQIMSEADFVVIVASDNDWVGQTQRIAAAVKFIDSPHKYDSVVISIGKDVDNRIKEAIGGVVQIDDKNAGNLFAKGIKATSKL